jgi:hypothetical protein
LLLKFEFLVVTDFLVPKLLMAAAKPNEESRSIGSPIMPSISVFMSAIFTLLFEILFTLLFADLPLAEAAEL